MPNNLQAVSTIALPLKSPSTSIPKSRSLTPAFVVPRFDDFAAQNPFVGAKIGTPRALANGWAQEYERSTAYGASGAFASEIHEVHGAIRERYKALGGPDGFLGLPLTNELTLTDGRGKFNHFERGSIFWHQSTGAHEVHGEVRNHWESLGWEKSWLGYPTSDENALNDQDGGRISAFQHGAIYWWPDVGARAINNVCVHYTGFHCFGETDRDGFSRGDEPYATLGIVGPGDVRGVAQTQVYRNVQGGQGTFDVIEIYKGKPHGLALSAVLQELSGDDDQLAVSRKGTQEAVDRVKPLIEAAATRVPVVGPVLGPLSGAAWDFFKNDIVDALNSFIEQTLGFGHRQLGSDLIVLTPKQMVLLAIQPAAQFNAIPWKFETQLLARHGASYKLYFNIFPV